MELILEQLPIVINALNIGFLQTLKLFFVTLIGAIPLGLVIAFGSMSRFKPLSYLTKIIVWIVRGTPLMIQLLIIYFGGSIFRTVPLQMNTLLWCWLLSLTVIPFDMIRKKLSKRK